jgi:hypothetical protein
LPNAMTTCQDASTRKTIATITATPLCTQDLPLHLEASPMVRIKVETAIGPPRAENATPWQAKTASWAS